MDTTPLYLGTSSWTAVGWETAFYPPHTKEAGFLPFYSSRFNSVEIGCYGQGGRNRSEKALVRREHALGGVQRYTEARRRMVNTL
jgi:hypothetical protein